MNIVYKEVASEMLAVGATAGGFTSTLAATADYALCYVDSGEAMIDCVNTPTSTSGRRVIGGRMFEIWGQNDLGGFKAIRIGSTDAAIYVQYFQIDKVYAVDL